MKKLLTILFICSGFVASAQNHNGYAKVYPHGMNTLDSNECGLSIDSNVWVKILATHDTTKIVGVDYTGKLVLRTNAAVTGVSLGILADSMLNAVHYADSTKKYVTPTQLSDSLPNTSSFATNASVHDTAQTYQTQSRIDMHDTANSCRTAITDSMIIVRDTFTAQSLRYLTSNQSISVYLTGAISGSASGTNSISIPTTLGIGAVNNGNIAIGAVTNASVSSSAAITYSKLNLSGDVQLTDLSATGTASSTTFLRGDNTWATPVNSGGTVTTVTVNPLSPLFTASVSNPTTTPAITFTANSESAHTFYGVTGTANATPAFSQVNYTDLAGSMPTSTLTVNGTSMVTGNSYTIPASANTLTTTTLNPTVINSSLQTIGTLTAGSIPYTLLTGTPTISCTINGVAVANGTSQTVTAAAGTLTGTTLNASVVTTSVNVVGAITTGTWTATPITGTYIASSAALAGSPTTTTQSAGTSNTTIATTAFVNNNYVAIVADTSIAAAYTLTSRDNNRTIIYTGSSNIAVTIPSGLALPFVCSIIQSTTAAGTVTPTASGTTLYMPNTTTKTGGSAAWIAIKEISSNNYAISGWTQ